MLTFAAPEAADEAANAKQESDHSGENHLHEHCAGTRIRVCHQALFGRQIQKK
jgi:hypothetical protein